MRRAGGAIASGGEESFDDEVVVRSGARGSGVGGRLIFNGCSNAPDEIGIWSRECDEVLDFVVVVVVDAAVEVEMFSKGEESIKCPTLSRSEVLD
jgi:hypothetical protein